MINKKIKTAFKLFGEYCFAVGISLIVIAGAIIFKDSPVMNTLIAGWLLLVTGMLIRYYLERD